MSKVKFGIAGFSYPDWEGVVYPKPKPKGFEPLEFIIQLVEVVEINSSFYSPLSANSVEHWIKIVKAENKPGFCFSAKLWQKFTHQNQDWSKPELAIFKDGLLPILESGLLAGLLAQFPFSFHQSKENFQRLKRIAEEFKEFPLWVELRHNSWLKEWFLNWLKENNIGLANIDQPIFSHSILPTEIITANSAYVRLHGRNKENWFKENSETAERYDYFYELNELGEWIERIKRLEQKAETLYVICNNHFQGKGLANALMLKFLFSQQKQIAPKCLIERYPVLREFCQPMEPQRTLF